MAQVIKKYAEGDVIEKPTVEEAVKETLEPFQPVENPSVQAAMVPQQKYVIHRGYMEYDPTTVRNYITNDYNLKAWGHNRGLSEVEQVKFQQAVQDMLVSGIDAGTLDFKDDNSVYVPEQYSGDGNYNTKDTFKGKKIITDDDKAARIEAVNYLKSAFAHGYIQPKVNKIAFNADRIIMQALAEKVGNGSMSALQSVWQGLSPLERQRVLRDTLNHLDYQKIFENYDFSNTDVKNAQELQQRVQALQTSFTGGDLTNENYQAAGKVGLSILKDLIYGRERKTTPSSTSSSEQTPLQAELKNYEDNLRAQQIYSEDEIRQMVEAERQKKIKEARDKYDIQVNEQAYQNLTDEFLELNSNPISITGTINHRYEPEEGNTMRGLTSDIETPGTALHDLAQQMVGSEGLKRTNQYIENYIRKNGNISSQERTTLSNILYILRNRYQNYQDGYICLGYFPNLKKIVYADLKTLSISTSPFEGTCLNSDEYNRAKRNYASHQHPNLNYDNYINYTTRTVSIDKEGGILKAQQGAAIGSFNEIVQGAKNLKQQHFDNKVKAQVESGIKEKTAIERNKDFDDLSPYDYARIGSITADVASLITSFGVGGGTIASGGLGLLSTVIDAGADIADPAVTKTEAFKNAGMNLGMAAVGMIPGGKAASVGAKIVKYTKILTHALTMYGMYDAATQVAHISDNIKKYGWKSVSKQDWINLGRSLSNLSQGTAGTTRAFKHNARRNKFSTTVGNDKFVIDGNFVVNGKKVSSITLDSVNDKLLIDNLKAATTNKDRLQLLVQSGKITDNSENSIKIQDNRSWFKKKLHKGDNDVDKESWTYNTQEGNVRRILSWDEFVQSPHGQELKQALDSGNIQEVSKALNSKNVRNYLSILSIENPTSYKKAMTDIRTIKRMIAVRKTVQGSTQDEIFNTLHQGKTLREYIDNDPINYKSSWFTPSGIQERIESSYLARPFVNDEPTTTFWGGVKSTGAQLNPKNRNPKDYRKTWANTPDQGKNIENILRKGLGEDYIGVFLKGNKGSIKSILRELKDKKHTLDSSYKSENDEELLKGILMQYIHSKTGKKGTASSGSKTTKSVEEVVRELVSDRRKFSNLCKFIQEKYIKELDNQISKKNSPTPSGTSASNGTGSPSGTSIHQLGGVLFAKSAIKKYQTGGRAGRFSNTQIAGSKDYPIYDWNAFVKEEGVLENLLNDIYGTDGTSIADNLKNYNTYNSEFFKLKKELFADAGFKEGTRFRSYNPLDNYGRTVFNDTKFGQSINSHFAGANNPRKDDTETGKYFDQWWGTQQNVRHFGDIENKNNLQNLINSKLQEWSNSNDPELKKKAEALKGLTVNDGQYGDLQYSLQTSPTTGAQNPDNGTGNNSNTAQTALDKYIAQGNDTERNPQDTYKPRIDWGNIGELARLYLANRTNDQLRQSYKKDKVALESPAYKQGTIASTYAIENANEDASNRVLAAMQNGPATSDAALNMAGQQNAYEQILKTAATNNATRDKYYQENVNTNQEIANYNRAAGVTTANKNREAIVKWYNDYLDHMRDLDVEDFNNRDRWMAGLIQQWIQKRALENNLNYQRYALNQDYNNVLYKLGLNNALEQTINERIAQIRAEAAKAGITDEDTIQEIIANDNDIKWERQKAILAGVAHDNQSKIGLNDAMAGTISYSPYWQYDVYNRRQIPPIANTPYIEVDLGVHKPAPKVTINRRGGKVEYTEDKARKKLFDIMGREYLDMLKRNSKYVLHKK